MKSLYENKEEHLYTLVAFRELHSEEMPSEYNANKMLFKILKSYSMIASKKVILFIQNISKLPHETC